MSSTPKSSNIPTEEQLGKAALFLKRPAGFGRCQALAEAISARAGDLHGSMKPTITPDPHDPDKYLLKLNYAHRRRGGGGPPAQTIISADDVIKLAEESDNLDSEDNFFKSLDLGNRFNNYRRLSKEGNAWEFPVSHQELKEINEYKRSLIERLGVTEEVTYVRKEEDNAGREIAYIGVDRGGIQNALRKLESSSDLGDRKEGSDNALSGSRPKKK